MFRVAHSPGDNDESDDLKFLRRACCSCRFFSAKISANVHLRSGSSGFERSLVVLVASGFSGCDIDRRVVGFAFLAADDSSEIDLIVSGLHLPSLYVFGTAPVSVALDLATTAVAATTTELDCELATVCRGC